MRVFLDANILFAAAHNPKGNAAKIVRFGGENHSASIFTCDLAVEEARRNLKSKFQGGIFEFEKIIEKILVVKSHPDFPCPIALNKKDAPIFAAAVHFHATHFLTGDIKDFGPHMNQPKKTSGVSIQTVREFINTNQDDYPFLSAAQEKRRVYGIKTSDGNLTKSKGRHRK